MNIFEKRKAFLDDMLNYYSVDPINRRNNLKNPASFRNTCKYYPVKDTSEGCAIGRKIADKELCEQLDDSLNSRVEYIFDLLPDDLKQYGSEFLQAIQKLHDTSSYWKSDGLTEVGISRVETIINVYCTENPM